MRLMGFWVRVCQTGAAVHVPAVGGTGGLVVQEDVSSAVSPVARHLQAGTGDEEVSATHTHTHINRAAVMSLLTLGVSDLVALSSALENKLYPAAEGL